MCGRYTHKLSWRQIAALYRLADPPYGAPNLEPRYNMAPTQDAPVVRYNTQTGARSLDMLRWGLIPHWAKDPSVGNRLINARAETVASKPSFRAAFRERRCLVPASSFFEWKREGKAKQPYAIALKGGEPLSFAGLWENWKNPEGEWVRTFTIVTTEANELLRPLHDRMPASLDPADHAVWLGEQPAGPDVLLALLRPYPLERMELWPVSTKVNSPKNDGPDLLDPLQL